jgi:dTDP-4-amino-4,6-dideoxy-D-galactose acyltransferase
LIRGAHNWMRSRGAREARVVTQMINAPACRLYERAGYRQASVQNIYHFWPQTASAVAPLRRAA